MADIHITSNAPWLAPTTELKIWRKGRKQKVQEIYPNPGVYIKPMAQQVSSPPPMIRQIIAYDPVTNIYMIKAKKNGQTAEYPCEISYIDFNKGVVVKVEHYMQDEDGRITKYTKTASNYIFINSAWVFRTLAEDWSSNVENTVYATTSTYSNIVINSRIPGSIFE